MTKPLLRRTELGDVAEVQGRIARVISVQAALVDRDPVGPATRRTRLATNELERDIALAGRNGLSP
jgi:hypothetical protein